jgi:hypothetical protein
MSASDDITGQRRHWLLAMWQTRRVKTAKASYSLWMVRCDCGKLLEIARNSFGRQVSCGCAPRRKTGRTIHGMSGTPTHTSWLEMRRRCLNRNHVEFPNYGGRGIKIASRWGSFSNFLADMGKRPIGTSLDRIDNNGNYEHGNCKWSTPSEQASNRRPKVKHVCWKPVPFTLAQVRQWAHA